MIYLPLQKHHFTKLTPTILKQEGGYSIGIYKTRLQFIDPW